MDLTIIGCGAVGRRVARLARQQDWRVTAVVRSETSRTELASLGLEALCADLDQPQDLGRLELAGRAVLYLAPPPPSGTTDPRMENFCAAAAANPPARIVYVSTTGVYGDCRGAPVDETRPPAPRTERAQRRLAAETALRDWAGRSGTAAIILRVAGIYGPGRLPLDALRERRPILAPEVSPWSNRIHLEDLARICLAALERGRDGDILNVCDGEQGTMSDFFLAVAAAFDLPRPPVVGWEEAQRRLSPAMLSFLGESRRIDNRRCLERLGIDLLYPDLRSGLRACRQQD